MANFEDMRQAYALDFTWDVRNHVPPHQDDQGNIDRTRTDAEENDRTIQQSYNRINMMTFLMDGIPFNVFLNESLLTWIDHLIYRVADQGRWPGRVAPNGMPSDPRAPYRRASQRKDHQHFPDFPNNGTDDQHESDLRELIHTQLMEAKNAATGNPPIRLRTFWEIALADLEQWQRDVYDALKVLKDDSTHGHRFCLPFVTIQEETPPALVPRHIMASFITLLTGVTHLDVYTKSVRYFPDIRTGIDLGKQYNIFEAPPSHAGQEEFALGGGSGGANNRICNPDLSTCISNPNTSCTTDANGYCTAG